MQTDVHDSTEAEPPTAFLRLPGVLRFTNLGRSTIYQLIADDKFPKQVHLSARAVAWRRSDLDNWSKTRAVSRRVG
ncbi:AlpA family transcriptional regulator [Paucibacter sp. R3-3]|uniref:AlpA family transcriptional regulator n=1 Tax=Roseateles agri TaxID=3098619 RepID=A0ABU5DKP8_9BURK|nr:AlpA family transcriptional regulator [Paucibacter sp. R3-3]MDY0745677.1 AlpA family transcriptional regulator [Paucibacter sp. R3-3]